MRECGGNNSRNRLLSVRHNRARSFSARFFNARIFSPVFRPRSQRPRAQCWCRIGRGKPRNATPRPRCHPDSSRGMAARFHIPGSSPLRHTNQLRTHKSPRPGARGTGLQGVDPGVVVGPREGPGEGPGVGPREGPGVGPREGPGVGPGEGPGEVVGRCQCVKYGTPRGGHSWV
jgi:hypothetical protein